MRPAKVEEVAGLASLQGRSWSRDAGFVWKAALEQRAERGDLLGCFVDGQPAGYVLLARRRDLRCHVSQVIVHEDLWRNGCGADLMRMAAQLGQAAGCDALTVKCAEDALAQQFWPTVGLRPLGLMQLARRVGVAWSMPLGDSGRLRMPPRSRRLPRGVKTTA